MFSWSEILRVALVAGVLIIVGASARGAILVEPAGAGPITFSTAPAATEWTTYNQTGDHFAFNSAATLDASVANLSASTVVNALPTTTSPPGANNQARWVSNGGYVVTRPTGNGYTVLMATLQNNTGTDLSSIVLSYDMARLNLNSTVEQVDAHRVYYSLTGNPGEWTPIEEISSHAPGTLSTTLSLGSWPAGNLMYLIWVDDNSESGTDDGFSIDNLVIGTGVVAPVGITNQPTSLTIFEHEKASFSVIATGSPPITYTWFKDNAEIPGANNSTYSIASAALGDAGTYYVVVSNAAGPVTSSSATLTVNPDTTAPRVLLAYGSDDLTKITVIFSEPVEVNSAQEVLYYSVTDTAGGAPFFADTATLVNGTNVVLDFITSPRVIGHNYTLDISSVTDLATTPNTMAPQTLPLHQFDSTPQIVTDTATPWKYFEAIPVGTDISASGWESVAFDDSAWLDGFNGFVGSTASESLPAGFTLNTTALTPPNGGGAMTVYYRTRFVFSGSNTNAMLEITGVFDDSAIFYLNGREVARLRVPAGPVTSSSAGTLAPETSNSHPLDTVLALVNGGLHSGTNVLAVETHQDSTGSSDVVMAMQLRVSVPQVSSGPPMLTLEPVSATVAEGGNHTFTAAATGQAPLAFQWLKAGVDIPGATASSYTVTNAIPTDDADYSVRVSNPVNPAGVTSSNAHLTVIADLTRPAVVSAIGDTNLAIVIVSFSEPVTQASAETAANYHFALAGGGGDIDVATAVLTNGTNVILTLNSPRVAGATYVLTVNNVADTSYSGNTVVENSQAAVRPTTVVLAVDAPWRYDQTGVDRGTTWREVGYDDSLWLNGPGLFDVSRTTPGRTDVGGETVRTFLSLTNEAGITNITYYFRTHFNLPSLTNVLALQVTYFVDDGAVFYLNGQEVLRTALLTNNPVYWTNFADAAGAVNASRIGPVTLEITNAVAGDNVLAVEVHQHDLNSSDVTFGAELRAIVAVASASAPVLHVARDPVSNAVTLSWDGSFCLQETDNLQGPGTVWTTSAVQNGVPFVPAGPQKFYRLRDSCP